MLVLTNETSLATLQVNSFCGNFQRLGITILPASHYYTYMRQWEYEAITWMCTVVGSHAVIFIEWCVIEGFRAYLRRTA